MGNIKLTEEILNKLQQVISEAGYSYQLDADLSPKFVVGYVKTKEKHPNADKLSILSVDVATEVLQIVCGAPNVEAGQKLLLLKLALLCLVVWLLKMRNYEVLIQAVWYVQ